MTREHHGAVPLLARWAAVIAIAMMFAAVVSPPAFAAAGDEITLTFIRHAQSAGNASGLIDTSTPGPCLTDLGWTQAHQVAKDYRNAGFDGIFASTMVRTQQTAQFLADELHQPIDVLPGLREIEAGDLEGQPESRSSGFFDVLEQWTNGDLDARIPGSIDGREFDARFDEAVDAIYASGDRRPVAFSHGGAIAVWTLLNVRGTNPALLRGQPLTNTGRVVVRGSPSAGWTLIEWNGTRI